ncbi:MAG: S1C family serine protease, partial [Isosphaeraceae bacterium]
MFSSTRSAPTPLLFLLAAALPCSPALAEREPESLSASFRKAAERVLPSVVAVRPLGVFDSGLPFVPPGMPRFFPGQILPGAPRFPRHAIEPGGGSTGSGVVIDAARGLILTTEQATSGAARVTLIFTDGREIEANRVVRDPRSELVLLSIDPQNVRLKQAEWGSSEKLQLGDWVLSVGRPTGRTHAVSAGIVSGRGAGPEPNADADAIRTDAVLNLANAGGPLVDLDGKVVGINRAGLDPGSRQAGFGFAIPAERARRFAADLADVGHVRHGYLGLIIGPDGGEPNGPSAGQGLVVTGVNAGGPAEDAGIRVGDRIVGLNGGPIIGLEALSRAVDSAPVGQEFRLTVDRGG